MNSTCKIVLYNSELYHQSIQLRDRVLRQPLNLKFTETELAQDKVDTHIAYVVENKVVGILVLKKVDSSTYKMRQVAVDPLHQNLGIGAKMVKFSEQFAKQNGITKITLSARDVAIPFYKKIGYSIVGEGFVEVGIAHHTMEKII